MPSEPAIKAVFAMTDPSDLRKQALLSAPSHAGCTRWRWEVLFCFSSLIFGCACSVHPRRDKLRRTVTFSLKISPGRKRNAAELDGRIYSGRFATTAVAGLALPPCYNMEIPSLSIRTPPLRDSPRTPRFGHFLFYRRARREPQRRFDSIPMDFRSCTCLPSAARLRCRINGLLRLRFVTGQARFTPRKRV